MFELNGKYTKAIIYTDNCESTAISQIMGLCNHPAFNGAKIRIMPDVHAGAGCTVGTTIHLKEKKVIPNIVGVDIGCGVLGTIFKTENPIDFEKLHNFIFENVPNGHGVRTDKHKNMDKEVETMISEVVSELKIGREDYHMNSCGSLGGGNHFCEINKIDENTYVLFVHSGSRNLGKKVCEYFQKKATENYSGKDELKEEIEKLVTSLKSEKRETEIADKIKELKTNFIPQKSGFPKELAFVEDEMYEAYVRNMIKCQRIAKENRKLITDDIMKHLGITPEKQFDTIHNYIEQLEDGSIIIRKGAISAKKGELLSIPLNMKDGVIIGVGKGNEEWNNSAPHGAGRLLSRSEANNTLSLEEFIEQMKDVNTWSVCEKTLDEAPMAYKSANEIVANIQDTIDILCIAKPVFNFKAH